MCPVLLRYSPNYVTDLSYNTVRDTGSLGDNATARSRGGGGGGGAKWLIALLFGCRR
jgi:hypothetical protein